MNWENEVIWITGSSSGIGKSLAIKFSKFKCKLILTSRNITDLKKVKNLLSDKFNIVSDNI